ncbi:MAG: hypothetical protein HYS13_18150 [Planctomycetia bacterium]|nr:hypothetical protein [Planctomycetia bacterium]
MIRRAFRSIFACLLLSVLAVPGRAPSSLAEEMKPVDLNAMIGQKLTIALKNGKSLESAELTKAVAGPLPLSVKSLTVKTDKGRSQTVALSGVQEIYLGDETLDIVYDRKTNTLAHSPERRQKRYEHAAAVRERLAAKGGHLWEDLSDDKQEQYVAEEKEFLKKVEQGFPRLRMTLYETKYFLFFTDMPQQQIAVYIEHLDKMYEFLGTAFGVRPGKNIWRGKCVVVAFIDERHFLEFESTFMMNNEAAGTAQGLCHGFPNGRVLISCHRGGDPVYFAKMLVHETSHGYLHRHKSTPFVQSWINEGIADWVSYAVTKHEEVKRRQKEAYQRIAAFRTLGGDFFTSRRLERWQYGLGSGMVEYLLRVDAQKFRQLVDGIKEGLTWEESLKEAYGVTPEQLAQEFGKTVGLPGLRP